jgi:hypothetical protein
LLRKVRRETVPRRAINPSRRKSNMKHKSGKAAVRVNKKTAMSTEELARVAGGVLAPRSTLRMAPMNPRYGLAAAGRVGTVVATAGRVASVLGRGLAAAGSAGFAPAGKGRQR